MRPQALTHAPTHVRVGASSGSIALPLLGAAALGGAALLVFAKPVYALAGALAGLFVGAQLNKESSSKTNVGQFWSKAISKPVVSLPAPPVSGPYSHLVAEGQIGVANQIRSIVRDFYRKRSSWLYWADYLQRLHDSLAVSKISPAALAEIKRVETILRTEGTTESVAVAQLEPYLYPIGCT